MYSLGELFMYSPECYVYVIFNDPLLSTEAVRHESLYIILYITGAANVMSSTNSFPLVVYISYSNIIV